MKERGEVPIAAMIAIPLTVGFLAGGVSAPAALDARIGSASLAVAAALVALAYDRRGGRRVGLGAGAAGIGLGACAAALAALPLPPDHLARFADRATVAVEGRIVRSERAGERITMVVLAERMRGRRRQGAVSGRLGVTIAHARAAWPVGSRVRVVGRLRRPHNFGNPGGYDLETALARRGIYATTFLWDESTLEPLPGGSDAGVAGRLRADVTARVARLSAEPARGFLTAVLLGATQSLEPATRDALTRTGLAHVVSVSGFHVAVAAASCFVLVRWLALRVTALALRYDVAKLAALVGLVPVAGYAAIAGESVPAARAFLMYAVVLAAVCRDRRPDGLRTLAVAALALGLPVPDVAADVSFQLSFVSVLGLILLGRGPGRGPSDPPAPAAWWCRAVVRSLAVSLTATVVTAPLTAWHFQQVSLIAPLANLVALPLLGPGTLVPGLLALPLTAVWPDAADVLLALAARAANAGLVASVWLSRVPWAAVATPMPSLLEIGLCYAALALVWWAPAMTRGRRCAAALVILLALGDAGYWLWQRFGTGTLRVTFLSVGQGDAAVVELPGGTVLVVDGGGFAGDFDPGERLIAPFLRARKILRVDVLALSHPQLDHYGGLAHLAEHFAPRELWWNGVRSSARGFARLEAALAAAGTRRRVLTRGMHVRLAGAATIEVLHPSRQEAAGNVNDGSLVLRIAYGDTSILFTGDVERGAESAMLAAAGSSTHRLASTVLKVPHHGSATSTSAAWLAAVAPAIAVVSSGVDNRFGFPAPAVLRRLAAVGAATWNTADAGAVQVTSDGRSVEVQATRVADGVRARQRFVIPASLW